jgi:type IX secretion system PorP/SprF family membrane protein
LGINAGYALRSFDNVDGMWASQYDGIAYNPGIASGEDFNNQNFGYFDAGAGILYTYAKKVKAMARNVDRRVNVGVAAYHITRPNNSFVDLKSERLPIRYTAFANASISISGTDLVVLPGVYYQRQGNFQQYLLGTNLKYKINIGSNYTGYERPFAVSLGLFTRIKDSFIAKLIIDWDQFSVGYAYDFTVSSLTSNSNRLGASEIFLSFNIGDGGGFRYNKN